MNLDHRIVRFGEIGDIIEQIITCVGDTDRRGKGTFVNRHLPRLNRFIRESEVKNAWFLREDIMTRLKLIRSWLDVNVLREWTGEYQFPGDSEPAEIAVIDDARIPFNAFHDMLSILITGNAFLGKFVNEEDTLLKWLAGLIIDAYPEFSRYIDFTDSFVPDSDAFIIANDRNNPAFRNYFHHKHALVRQRYNSGAVLDGSESEATLQYLAKDIFAYFGLSDFNVSKVFVPGNYDFTRLFRVLDDYGYVLNHSGYANNYDYNKSIYILNNAKFLDNGFILFKEDAHLRSPTGVVFYEFYSSRNDLETRISNYTNLQNIVADGYFSNEINFSNALRPKVDNYSNFWDIMDFLLNIK